MRVLQEGGMEFLILGSFEVADGSRKIPLGGAKPRALLVLLLLARGRPVSARQLIEEIWGDEAPETALKSVQVYVSQLRKAIGQERLVTRDGGYALIVEPNESDIDQFENLVRAAGGVSPQVASERLQQALALFRGEPLADFSLERWARPEIELLEGRRLAALEARIDADLEFGRHRELVPELEELVARRPFDEHVVGQLMLALYRSGRQADALKAYRAAARRLRDELGLEPSRPLQELERLILRQGSELDAPAQVTPTPRRRRAGLIAVSTVSVIAVATVAVVLLSASGGKSTLTARPGSALIDIRDGTVVSEIPWAQMRYPAELSTGGNGFWAWVLDGYSLDRIDSHTGEVSRTVASPFGSATLGFLVDGGSVWFAGTRLVRIDLASGQEVNRYALTRDPSSDGLASVVRGAGSLWVTRPQAAELLRVNPASGRVQHRFTHLHDAYAVAYDSGAAWVVTYDSVERVDAATNAVTTVSLPPPIASIAAGGGFGWASNEAKGTVYKIDGSGRIVTTYTTAVGARDMSYADGTLWVTNQDAGTVSGIDAATGAQRTVRFRHPLQSVAALHGRLLVVVNPGLTYEDRVDALKGKVLRIFDPIYEFDHPDPAISGNGYLHSFMFQAERATCAPLLGYADAPPPRGQRLVPEVAAAPPTLSRDRRTYTFRVRRGFRFAPPSGALLDAVTYQYSIERALSPRLGPRAIGINYLTDLVGARAFHSGHARHVRGIRVRGNQISFTLTQPSPDFLERLALPYFCPVPRTTPIVAGGVGIYTGPAPPGAGPYTFSGLVFNGEYAILKRNPNYGGTRPQNLDAIAFREGIDTEQAVARVARGGYDMIEQYDPLLSPDGALARRFSGRDAPGNTAYLAFPTQTRSYLALDTSRPPFSYVAVRQAVSAALARNRRSLANFWNLTPTSALLPLSLRATQQSAEVRPPTANTPLARALVSSSRSTVFMAVQAGDDKSRQFADLVHDALAPLGIDVQPAVVSDVVASVRAPRSRIQLANLTTSIDEPDPASFLTQMLDSDLPPTWVPKDVRRAVETLNRASGKTRDRLAIALGGRLERRDPSIITYGAQELGTILGPRVGCRVWNGVDPALDLAALCVQHP